MKKTTKKLSAAERTKLLATLATRFKGNMSRHKKLEWESVLTKLEADPSKLVSLSLMEATGGEPDVIDYDKKTDEYIFCDCSAESPLGRRSVCYDKAGLESRKEHQPENNAIDMAASMGAELLTEAAYRQLQTVGEFDLKTSSWVAVPAEIRKQGGAIFCDKRYGTVFLYHNGPQSYYSSRGFRCSLRV